MGVNRVALSACPACPPVVFDLDSPSPLSPYSVRAGTYRRSGGRRQGGRGAGLRRAPFGSDFGFRRAQSSRELSRAEPQGRRQSSRGEGERLAHCAENAGGLKGDGQFLRAFLDETTCPVPIPSPVPAAGDPFFPLCEDGSPSPAGILLSFPPGILSPATKRGQAGSSPYGAAAHISRQNPDETTCPVPSSNVSGPDFRAGLGLPRLLGILVPPLVKRIPTTGKGLTDPFCRGRPSCPVPPSLSRPNLAVPTRARAVPINPVPIFLSRPVLRWGCTESGTLDYLPRSHGGLGQFNPVPTCVPSPLNPAPDFRARG